MRVGFAGTPAFAAVILDALVGAGFEVPLVLTQPDRRQGRGLKEQSSAVKHTAMRHSIPLQQPVTLKTDHGRSALLAIPLDVLVVAAYGLLLPRSILDWPRCGCVNVHASLLPRWRGAAPLQRALMEGDHETGITLMQMDEGLDTGSMLDIVRVPIESRETAGSLQHKLAQAGARAIVELLGRMARGEMLAATAQPSAGVTYAAKIETADATIDWRQSAATIDRLIRALNPAPGAIASLYGKIVKLWAARPVDPPTGSRTPGVVLAASARGVIVACGEGALELIALQPAGGKSMPAAAFVAGRRLHVGHRFD